MALAQSDIKKLLAFHSVSQMGYILAAFGAGSSLSLAACASHLVNHAFFKSLLFLVAGTVIASVKERDLHRLGSLGARLPALACVFAAAALSIAGMPPWGGYVSKQLIAAGLAGSPAYILVWLTGVGTAASFVKLSLMFLPRKIELPPSVVSPVPPPKSVYPPLFLLAGLCLALGLFPAFWTEFFASLTGGSLAGGSFAAGSPGGAVSGAEMLPDMYRLSGVGGAFLSLAAGIALCRLVLTRRGQLCARWAEKLLPGFQGTLFLCLAGVPLLFLAVSLAAG
jgi:multicomponent Na+:H+ antiporter subunit D